VKRLLWATMVVLVVSAACQVGIEGTSTPESTVEVMHWTSSHLFRDGLLPDMAVEFNAAGHKTSAGNRIVIIIHNVPSQLQGDYLISRVEEGQGLDLVEESSGYVLPGHGDPIIVTPSSAHWLVRVNFELKQTLIDLAAAPSIVRPVIGIVTYEDMARCLGWPEKALGYRDILALAADPDGWGEYDCAKAEWGQRPLVAYTNPGTSSTGRSLLLGLYAIAADKLPEQLIEEDVTDPAVVDYVTEFQNLVAHYAEGTSILNTKIHQGPRFGHFFIMPEDNLIQLYEGTTNAYINGVPATAPPIQQRMVMIYPEEGVMPRSNCGCIVQASWVSEEQAEAAQQWIEFLLEDEQQGTFMAAGFRPGTDISLDDPNSKITREFGLDPNGPTTVLNPSLIDPAVAAAIDEAWVDVKRPRISTFVVDTSGSMRGTRLAEAQDALYLALEEMEPTGQVGLIAFDDTIHAQVLVGPLSENRFAVADAVGDLRVGGGSMLYDAVKLGIEMTEAAEGQPNAIRALVVLTDGRATEGVTRLDELIEMRTPGEAYVVYSGFEGDSARDELGNEVNPELIRGVRLVAPTRNPDQPVQIFFIGIGDDVDLNIGRLLAEATGAEFVGVTEEDLSNALEAIGIYF
jgi:Ca-activated chloride channel family protein